MRLRDIVRLKEIINLRYIVTVSLLFLSIDSFSQYAEFKFGGDFYNCSAKFDSTKVTRVQLQNTFDYLWNAPFIYVATTPRKINEAPGSTAHAAEEIYSESIDKLETLEFVDDPFWSRIRDERITFYKSIRKLSLFTILAHSNPDTLLHYSPVDSTTIFYRDALIAGGETMLKAWVKLNEYKKSINGSPDRVQEKFDKQYNSPDRLKYAKVDLMTFGWFNNANHQLPHIDQSYIFNPEFERLFIEVDCQYDEP